MIGFISGVTPVALLGSLPPLAVACVLAGLSVLLGLSGRTKWAIFGSGLLLGLAAGILHGQGLLERRPRGDCELVGVKLQGTVASLPQITAVREGQVQQRFEFGVEHIAPERCSGPRKILLYYYGKEQLLPGQRWQLTSRLKRPWGLANPGSFNIQSWYAQNGIDAVGSVKPHSAVLLPALLSQRYAHHRLRHRISRQLAQLPLDAESISVLRALTVADKSGMPRSVWQLFQRYGISHLLVISGLHIGLVAGLGLLLGRVLGRLALLLGHHSVIAFLPGLLAVLMAASYAAVAGFSLPTSRALIMLSAFVAASVLGRRAASWHNLLLAAFAVLLFNPLAALGSGFWLSFGAVTWLLWTGLWHRKGGKLKQALVTHLCMAAFMVPLGGWWFGGASIVSALANLVFIPLVGIVVVPMALLGVAAQQIEPLWGEPLLLIAAWPFEQLIPMALRLEAVSKTQLYWQFVPTLPAVLLAVAGLAVLVVSHRPRVLVLAILLSLPLFLPRGRSWDPQLYVAKLTVLDVGQGTAVVLQGPQQTLIYDTGGGDPLGANMAVNVILPYLRGEGISLVDTLIISHADNDHSAGTRALLEKLAVGRMLFGGDIPERDQGTPCRAGQAWRWTPDISFQILSATGEAGLSSNNSSCVLQIKLGNRRVLLPGDIDRKREQQLVRYWREQLKSDWLLSGHHGSGSSSSRVWLKFVQADTVVFSSGYGNGFGHPHPDIVQRTRDAGSRYHLTSTDGALEFYLSREGGWQLKRFRQENWRYWF